MTAIACPRCAHSLTRHETKTAILQGCLSCGGIFVDKEGRNRVVATGCTEVASASDIASQHARMTPDTRAPIQCPMCRTAMATTRLAAGGVDIDVCDHHGAWFDRNELRLFIDALVAQRGLGAAPSGKKKSSKNVALGVGVGVGVAAAAGVAYAASSPGAQQQMMQASSNGGVVDTVVDVAEVAVDAVDVVDVTFSVFSFFGDILGALAD